VVAGSFWYFATKQRSAVAVPDGMHEIVYFDYGDDEKVSAPSTRLLITLSCFYLTCVCVDTVYEENKRELPSACYS
jgi:hypothetical protein